LYLFGAWQNTAGSTGLNGYVSNYRLVKGTCLYPNGTTFTVPTTPLTPVANTSLLTLRDNGFTDDGPNRFAITRSGDVRVVPFSPFKSHTITANSHSVYFDGTGDYLTVANNAAFDLGSGDATIETWIFPTSSGQTCGIFDKRSSGVNYSQFPQIALVSGAFVAYVSYSGSSWAGTINGATPAVNTWTHVAFVRSGNTWTLYVNGVVSGTPFTASGSVYTSTDSLVIGASTTTGTNPFVGYISNARIVKGTAVYTSTFTAPTTPLTAITNTSLLTCQSTTIIDNSTNAFTITVAGNATASKFNPFGETATQVVEYSANTHGGSVYFDGTSDSLITTTTVPAIGTGDFTIDAWVYLLSAPSVNGWIYGNRSGSATSGYLFISSSLVPVYGADAGSIDLTSSTAVKVATWNHIAVSRSGSTIRLFLNGILVASATNTNNYSYAGTQPVGYASSGTAYTLNGYISDLRVVLGTALYKSSFIPPSTTLSAVPGTVFLLNNDRGGIVDVSGRNVLECVGNARVSTDTKKYGTGAMYFDGTGDGLSLPANQNISLGTGDFTIEMWINGANSSSPVGGSFPRLFTLGTAQGTGCIEVYNSSSTGITVAISAGTNITFAGGTLLNSTWNHFAITRSGTSLKAFVNGTQVGSTNTNSTNLNLAASTQSWIGSISASAGNFTGYIDDLRITKGVARYTTNFTAPISALITK
jgi:hypothetical protein